MASKVKEFLQQKTQALAEQARTLREAQMAAARGVAANSAARIRDMDEPVRAVARSGVRLTALSQGALQNLIELQQQIVSSALDEAATQLENVARTENVMDLVRDQSTVLRAARERILADMNRAVAIVADAGRGARDVAKEAYGGARKTPAAPETKRRVRVAKVTRGASAKRNSASKSANKSAKKSSRKAAGRRRSA